MATTPGYLPFSSQVKEYDADGQGGTLPCLRMFVAAASAGVALEPRGVSAGSSGKALQARDASPGPWRTRRVAVCLFGVVPRSIRLTWPSIRAHLYEPLRAEGLNITTYVFNLHTCAALVDGQPIDQRDVSIIPYDVLE